MVNNSDGYQEALRRIEEARKERSQSLDLGVLGLKELPKEIGQLTGLTKLNLSRNILSELPKEIGQLVGLTELSLSTNRLSELPKEIGQLTSLTKLNLQSNQLSMLPKEIGQLTKLTNLSLYINLLNELPKEIGQLTSLKELYISDNFLSELPKEIWQLKELMELNIARNQLSELPCEIGQLTELRALALSGNGLSVLPKEIGQLTLLTTLFLSGNKLEKLPEEIGQLTGLTTLNLGVNQLSELPKEIVQLTSLTELWISNNQLRELPKEIGQLKALNRLILNENKIKKLPQWIVEFDADIVIDEDNNIEAINFYDNPIEEPPLEIVKQGKGAIRNYFAELKKGAKERYEAKLLILGDGNEGKTCVSRALRGLPFEKQKTTRGVEVVPWEFENDGKKVILNIWDFEGQEINHQSHQFFLTSQSLYLLVFKCRDQFLMERAEYWLDTIRARAPKSRVAIVMTECGGRTPTVPQDKLLARYKDTLAEGKWLFEVECDGGEGPGEGISELQQYLKDSVMQLEHMGRPWPKTYESAEESIEKLVDKEEFYKTRAELYKIFKDSRINESGFDDAAAALANLGIITQFTGFPDLEDFIVLDPQWLTKAISKIMEDKQLRNDKGEITFERMKGLWDDNGYVGMFAIFHNCMKVFELCYDMEDRKNGCLVPLRYGYEKPVIPWTLGEEVKERRVEYKLNIRPPMGVMSRFIVKAHHMICKTDKYPNGVYWYNGVFLRTGEGEFASEALCEFDNEDKILRITVKAPHPQMLIEQLHGIAQAVFEFFKGMKPQRSYGCIRVDENMGIEEQCVGLHPERSIVNAMRNKMLVQCSPDEDDYDLFHTVDPFNLVSGYNSIKIYKVHDLRRELDKKPEWAKGFIQDIRDLLVWVDKNNTILEQLGEMAPELIQQMEQMHSLYLKEIDKMLDDREFNSAPGLVLIEPVDGSVWNPKTYFKKEYNVVAFCECLSCKEPRIDLGLEPFVHDKKWWEKWAKCIAFGTKIVSIGLVAACAGAPDIIGAVAAEAVKYQLAMSKELAKNIELKGGADDKLDKKYKTLFDGVEEGRVGYFNNRVLREQLAMFLEQVAPANYRAKEWGSLKRVRMADDTYRWICDKCREAECC